MSNELPFRTVLSILLQCQLWYSGHQPGLPLIGFKVQISMNSLWKTKFEFLKKINCKKASGVDGSGRSVVTLHDRNKIVMTVERTRGED